MARLKDLYYKEIRGKLKNDLKFKNVMQVPLIKKIVINIGLGEALHNIKVLENAAKELSSIAGQKPVITKAKKAISGFKLRKGLPIGCCVTLHGDRMWEFYDRLVNVALPRIKDFRGLSKKSFDGRGSYTFGLKEQTIFPEIEVTSIDKARGMNITIATNARNDESALKLLEYMGFPFRSK